jgi:hypothetical protein
MIKWVKSGFISQCAVVRSTAVGTYVCAAGSKELLALRQIWQRGAVMPDCLAPLPAATDLAAAISVCLQSKTAPAQEVTDTAQKPGAAENAPVLAARRLSAAPRIKRLQAVCSRSGLTLLSSGAPRHAGVSALAGASGSEPPETISY